MNIEDPYRNFVDSYDLFRDITDIYPEEKKFFQKLFSIYNIHHILDCSCGTGRHYYMFSEMGYSIKASDISEAMLKKARENLLKSGMENINLTCCDFRDLPLHFSEEFDAVVCLTTSLPHIHEEKELLRALRSMKSVLKKDGILIVSQGTTHNSLKPERRFEVIINNIDFSRIFVKDISGDIQTIHILDLFHSEKDNRFEHYSVNYRILLDGDYLRLFTLAGFKNINIMGDYNMEPYNPDKSKRLIVTGQK